MACNVFTATVKQRSNQNSVCDIFALECMLLVSFLAIKTQDTLIFSKVSNCQIYNLFVFPFIVAKKRHCMATLLISMKILFKKFNFTIFRNLARVLIIHNNLW